MYCLLIPGLVILAFVAYQAIKMVRFYDGAQLVKAEVSWVPGEQHAHHFKKKDAAAMLRDKEFMRRHKYVLWVYVPEIDGQKVEAGLAGRGPDVRHPFPRRGDPLEVLYNPKRPEFVLLQRENMWIGLVLVGIIGVIFTVFASLAVLNIPH